jgi:hypothetical protein
MVGSMARANTSAPPPAGYGTTMVMGLLGYVCATAAVHASDNAAPAAKACSHARRPTFAGLLHLDDIFSYLLSNLCKAPDQCLAGIL